MSNRDYVFNPTKEELEKLYENSTMAEIAKSVGVHEDTVRKRFRDLGVTPRRAGRAREFDPDKDELANLYQRHSMKEIAKMFNVGETVVWNRLHEHGIRLQGNEDHGHRKRPRVFSREARLNMSRAKRGRWAGNKNPNWKGGVSEEHLRIRRSGAHKQWKIDVLIRAGYRCEECGVHQYSTCDCCGTRVSLHVHHIKSFTEYPDLRFDVDNGQALCPKCHYARHDWKTK